MLIRIIPFWFNLEKSPPVRVFRQEQQAAARALEKTERMRIAQAESSQKHALKLK